MEYINDTHTYLVDCEIVPSITQLLKIKFGNKYDFVNARTLQNASDLGTQVHESIERWCKTGEESDLKELRNFKFLKKQYAFEVLNNEVPVILFKDGVPVSAGRLDLVIKMNEAIGLADIKRTSTLDKEYLAYQLNLYRIAYQQTYGNVIELLKGIHLREDTRKFVNIPVNEQMAWGLVDEYLGGKNE